MSDKIVTFIVVFGFYGIVLFAWIRHFTAAMPQRVARRLARGEAVQNVRVTALSGGWNPSKPLGTGNRIFGPGRANYWLDDSGVVHMIFKPRSGAEQRFSGPLPPQLLRKSASSKRARKALGAAIASYGAAMGGGFAIGYSVAGKGTNRSLSGLVGMVIGLTLAWFTVVALRVGLAAKDLPRRNRRRAAGDEHRSAG